MTHGSAHVGKGQNDSEDAKTDDQVPLGDKRFLQLDLLLEHGIDLVVGKESTVGGVHLPHLLLVLIKVPFVVAVVGGNDRELLYKRISLELERMLDMSFWQ